MIYKLGWWCSCWHSRNVLAEQTGDTTARHSPTLHYVGVTVGWLHFQIFDVLHEAWTILMKFVTFGGYHTSLLFEAICMDFYSIEGFPRWFYNSSRSFCAPGKEDTDRAEVRRGGDTRDIHLCIILQGVVRCYAFVTWYDMTRHNMTWYDMNWYDVISTHIPI